MDAARFVMENTREGAPPLVPEIRLRLAAGEVVPLWERCEAETGVSNCPPPYWAYAWAGGQALARYILDHPEIVRGRTVLDFGSGSGLVAIAAAQAGAADIAAADIDPMSAAAITVNAVANRVPVRVDCADEIGSHGWQTILVGDMCYERELATRLYDWLRRETASGTAVFLGDPGRNYFFDTGMTRLASYDVPTSWDLEGCETRTGGVYRLL